MEDISIATEELRLALSARDAPEVRVAVVSIVMHHMTTATLRMTDAAPGEEFNLPAGDWWRSLPSWVDQNPDASLETRVAELDDLSARLDWAQVADDHALAAYGQELLDGTAIAALP